MVIPTHLFGIAEETSELYRKLKQKYPGVFVLQDCAHSFFCTDSTRQVVTQYGDGAIFGMNISKLVNSVRGGALTVRDAALANEIERIRRSEMGSVESGERSSLMGRLYALAAAGAFTRPGYEAVRFLSRHTRLLSAETDYYDESRIEMPKDFAAPMNHFEAEMGLRSSCKIFESRRCPARNCGRLYRSA